MNLYNINFFNKVEKQHKPKPPYKRCGRADEGPSEGDIILPPHEIFKTKGGDIFRNLERNINIYWNLQRNIFFY